MRLLSHGLLVADITTKSTLYAAKATTTSPFVWWFGWWDNSLVAMARIHITKRRKMFHCLHHVGWYLTIATTIATVITPLESRGTSKDELLLLRLASSSSSSSSCISWGPTPCPYWRVRFISRRRSEALIGSCLSPIKSLTILPSSSSWSSIGSPISSHSAFSSSSCEKNIVQTDWTEVILLIFKIFPFLLLM